jgi:hypothetical protein
VKKGTIGNAFFRRMTGIQDQIPAGIPQSIANP